MMWPSHALKRTVVGHRSCTQRVSWTSLLRLSCYAVFNGIVLIAFVLLMQACSSPEHYANAEAFKTAVARWGVVGQSLDAAKAELLRHEFVCDGARCYRDLDGFPCNQRLRVDLSIGANHLVDSFEIWTISGELPAQCL
ncbi:MAG: hypothetical protein K2Q17_08240 [Nitrospiraceae bacterium]|jgi:hypothetical protein|uniref:hypothetical protein n=1 Tax=Nitrospira cf. moscoviensis SBR1015 TaxID=96242 RepID=UPI000A0AB973|nr:hypothetical protein [Nitrospira cf. moscoviensis SBR1015]MBY0247643.1 hypothetical protein [Nitrospiraceae bacterium]OQW30760.1 MAG: hypothetical protein A4E20_16290 [Nitrospira sp. SG-bin2]